MKEIIKVNEKALSSFSKTLALSNKMLASADHHPAEWFDTPEKRLEWWLDLEPQWKKAFSQAVFFENKKGEIKKFLPTDSQLVYLFELKTLLVCGSGNFKNRNNSANINFQLTNLNGVENLTNLTRIECDFNGLIESLEPVRHLKKLETLWADNNNVTDLSPLTELFNLRGLCVWNNQISSLAPLATMYQLTDLTLGLNGDGNPLASLKGLEEMVNLRRLYIENCGISSLEPLRNCAKLISLIAQQNPIESLEPIKGLKSLYRIRTDIS